MGHRRDVKQQYLQEPVSNRIQRVGVNLSLTIAAGKSRLHSRTAGGKMELTCHDCRSFGVSTVLVLVRSRLQRPGSPVLPTTLTTNVSDIHCIYHACRLAHSSNEGSRWWRCSQLFCHVSIIAHRLSCPTTTAIGYMRTRCALNLFAYQIIVIIVYIDSMTWWHSDMFALLSLCTKPL